MAGLNRDWLLASRIVTALDDSSSVYFRYRNTGCFVINHILSFINVRLYMGLFIGFADTRGECHSLNGRGELKQ